MRPMSDVVSNLPVGSRVVVRSRLDPDEAAGASLTDAVGTLVSLDEHRLVVETSRGPVTIERNRVVAAKEVPPRPSRRGAAHLALSIADLQRVMVPSWGAVERAPLGDWALRASSGYTQRGNSVVTTGDPGLPLTTAPRQRGGDRFDRGAMLLSGMGENRARSVLPYRLKEAPSRRSMGSQSGP